MSTKPKTTESSATTHADPAPAPRGRSGHWWLRQIITATLYLGVGLILIVAMGVAQRFGFISTGGGNGNPTATGGNTGQVFTCPMHPQIRQPSPGNCPICGMTLVPAASGGGSELDEFAVTITVAARRLANIQTAEVKLEPVSTVIETIGSIAIDESRLVTIASYIDGRIERLFADYTGVVVEKSDHLAVVYSPELYSAQVEYLESQKTLEKLKNSTLESVRKAQTRLVENSRKRLVELGMKEEQIIELEQTGNAKSRLTIYAPEGGTVIEKMAVEGKYVKTGEPIYRIADLSMVWLMLELYPEDASRIRFGQRVVAELQSLPGEQFEGRVAFIDPTVSVQERTVGVRVEFLNGKGQLRPGDYARAKIFLPIGNQGEVYDSDLAGRWISPMHPQILRDQAGECPICGMDLVPTSRYGYSETPVPQPESLIVPRSALLMAGNNSVVYVETEPGRFEIRPVSIGPILKNRVVILSGVERGESVAVDGNFLIDSQMQLAGKPSVIDPTRAVVAQRERKQPLEFEHVHVTSIPGDAGAQLEELFRNYFSLQKQLVEDQKPTADVAKAIFQLAVELSKSSAFSSSQREELKIIAAKSEHLHHMKLDQARLEGFRPISQSIVKLATQVRGAKAETLFSHMFCPMVKGGSGDWLQPHDELRNPYYGSQMLTCGKLVSVFPLVGHLPGEPEHEPDQQPQTPLESQKD